MLVAKDATCIGDTTKLREIHKDGGYQLVVETQQGLRVELRYGKNPSYEDVQTSEIGNPQPSSYVRYDKDMEKVQRLDDSGFERTNHS